MPDTLEHIERYHCANATGVVQVKLVIPDQVTDYNHPTAEAGITVSNGAEIYSLPIDPFTGRSRETLESSGVQGDSHRQELGFDVRRTRQEVTDLRRKLMNRRVHAIFTDANDRTNLYLNVRLRKAEGDNPASGYNGTRLEFRSASVLPADFVQGLILPPPPPEDLPGGAPFIDIGEESGDNGGIVGGNPDDPIGGVGPGDGGNPGGGDTGGGDPSNTDLGRVLQPSTGNYFRLFLDECEGLYTEPIIE